jgi:pimeloyl-ACP methyl ester carboxylesterase
MERALGRWESLLVITAALLAVKHGVDDRLAPQMGFLATESLRAAAPSRDYGPPIALPQTPPPVLEPPSSVPILLVPGWGDDESHLSALAQRLEQSGWTSQSVWRLTFQDPVGSNREHAREIAQAALELKERTGAERVDMVAHSMGGLAARYFLQNGGDAHVRRIVFLATPHRGTVSAFFAWGEGAREMQPGSTFLTGLLHAPLIPTGVSAVTIRTPLDLHVLPSENAILPGFPDLRVCCPTHAGLLDDAETFEIIERFLKGAG